MEKLGRISELSGQSDTGPVIINAACTFLKQVVYPCHLRVLFFVGQPGRSSFMTWYEIRGTDQMLYTTGSAKMVWVDYRAERSIPLPPDIRSILEGA